MYERAWARSLLALLEMARCCPQGIAASIRPNRSMFTRLCNAMQSQRELRKECVGSGDDVPIANWLYSQHPNQGKPQDEQIDSVYTCIDCKL
jgi:hypothetical protein